MSEKAEFQCLRCSTCCRNLLENQNNVLRGLPLTEKETSLFPPEAVAPKLALGVDKPEKVILFQLKVGCCPFVNNQNECQIYPKRPLMCKSFPIVAGSISNRCRVFSFRKSGLTYDELYSMKTQLEASDRFTRYLQSGMRKRNQKRMKIWEFDLTTRKWIPGRLFEE